MEEATMELTEAQVRSIQERIAQLRMEHRDLDQVPDEEALVERQRFEDVGDVGRVQLIQFAAQLGDVLLMYDVLDQLMSRHLLAVHQALDDAMARQQLLHFAQFLLDVFALAEILDVGHGYTAKRGAAGREAAADGGL